MDAIDTDTVTRNTTTYDDDHDQQFSIGIFARLAGVTVRTIRYYDTIGLLKPSAYSDSGRRLYTAPDYARLQQILTLKLIGLSLDEIKALLTDDLGEIAGLLERQKAVLSEQVAQLSTVIRAIESAQEALRVTPHAFNLEQFIRIIQAVSMNQQTDWYSQFLTDDQHEKVIALDQSRTFDDHKRMGEAWRSLFHDIQQHGEGSDLPAETAQALVSRWDALMMQFADDDETLVAQMNAAYAQFTAILGLTDAPEAVREWVQSLTDAVRVIEQARHIRASRS